MRTVNDLYLDLRAELREKKLEDYQLEARELVCRALGITKDELLAKKTQFVFEPEEKRLDELKNLRLSGVPLQYLVGEWEFYGLDFFVTPDTLIPRSDTETLAELAINTLSGKQNGRLLDLCCGTGCVGIAVLLHISDKINGVFADISEPALAVARKNILRHNLGARACALKADALKPAPGILGKFDFIACNPPYIKTSEMQTLSAEVKNEPKIALDGGEDGLAFYRAISRNYKSALNPGGTLAFEVGAGQSKDVAEIMENAGFSGIGIREDSSKIERVVFGTV